MRPTKRFEPVVDAQTIAFLAIVSTARVASALDKAAMGYAESALTFARLWAREGFTENSRRQAHAQALACKALATAPVEDDSPLRRALDAFAESIMILIECDAAKALLATMRAQSLAQS
jgi:hypothetical protein